MLKHTLVRARALITDPAHFTQGTFARTGPNGFATTSREGTCWCARGAIRHIAGLHHERQFTDILNHAAIAVFGDPRGIVYVNDRLGHEAVLKVYDYAIANVQE